MKKVVLALIAVVAVAIIIVVYFTYFQEKASKYDLKGKKVLIVIFKGYNSIEYETTKNYLKKCKASITVLALHEDVGTEYDVYVGDVKDFNKLAEEYDAVVFIGGPGVYSRVLGQVKDGSVERAAQIALAFYSKNKIVAAICAAPGVLAHADILKGVKATCFPDTKLIDFIKSKGAEYVAKDVVKDGNIITAKGPAAAKAFAEKIAETLSGET
ncbi:MAG TPA: hypothetical protein ENF55_03100 [Thermoprotei archaeon]|nr:hypothetical protein [Thermoprotei archaeon]